MANHFSEYDSINIPPEFRPLGAWAYFAYSILFSIPILGLILLIVFSFSDSNINRRNYARSYFIVFAFVIILFLVLFFTGILTQSIDAFRAGEWPAYMQDLPWVK